MMKIFSPFLVALDPWDSMRRYCPSSADTALFKRESTQFLILRIKYFSLHLADNFRGGQTS